ncbi:hypothetical protein GCM10029978_061740 [Actinoallomurus acanthiterrae]
MEGKRLSDHLRFMLLGPLEAWSGDTRLDLGPPKRRVLLARLLIADSRPVSADRLGEDLWEGNPPAGALSSIHSHISRLRAVLEPDRTRRGGQTVLLSGPAGYTLNAPPNSRDSARFEEAVNHARGLLTRGRLTEARREVQRGLTLWRGTALADAASYAFAEREIARLEEIRLAAGELHATVLLHEGRPDEATFIAEELTTRSPLREAAWALLLRALYLAGPRRRCRVSRGSVRCSPTSWAPCRDPSSATFTWRCFARTWQPWLPAARTRHPSRWWGARRARPRPSSAGPPN